VIPIVTPKEMGAIDAAATEPVDVLIGRAGWATARAARRMLGGTYGRVVNVIAGPGNNGADGRAAGRFLGRRGVKVRVFGASECPPSLPPSDLVIDAAYGTGFHGEWRAPRVGRTPVLAVDIPSGVDGLTGEAGRGVLAADRTVTFAALKPGLLFGAGRNLAGEVEVAEIGLDATSSHAYAVDAADVARWWRPRPPTAHKWSRAVRVVAGSPGMTGAAHLASGAAQKAGAGMVALSSPGVDAVAPVEVVRHRLPAFDWSGAVLGDLHRYHVLIVGPGLGREDYTVESVRATVVDAEIPVVVDGDGLFAMAWNPDGALPLLRRRRDATVLTPHDGEYGLLTGHRPPPDRIAAARDLAMDTRAVVLLKGPTTVVAAPAGDVRVITTADARLATAGTGDVLSGILGALLASGMAALEAAASAAWIHAEAARHGPAVGLVAGDLLSTLPDVVARLG
jgi:ADP-dependent NAD(P)H-hydrate dehydratase / NAD(P)H-hydrate epimerase